MVMREIGCSMRRTSYPKNLVTEKAKIEMFEFRNTVTDSAKSLGRKLKNEMQKMMEDTSGYSEYYAGYHSDPEFQNAIQYTIQDGIGNANLNAFKHKPPRNISREDTSAPLQDDS